MPPVARGDAFDVIGFDADDTLWRSEELYQAAEKMFVQLLSPFVDAGVDVKAALTATERKNLHIFGYGVKAFGLSMVECAATIAPGRIGTDVMKQLIETAKAMLAEPVQLLPDVPSVLEQVGSTHRIVLITKGDLIHQTAKVNASGLAHHFESIEIVVEKDPATYAHIVKQLGIEPARFCMVGNSVRSDVLPVLSIGGTAVHVPYHLLWDLELAPHDHGQTFAELRTLAELPGWLAGELPLEASAAAPA
jgi:putative hydrolase of the HAD superfamily